MEYRHELKFQVTFMELQKIRYRLEPVLTYDKNQRGDYYMVRSLYFDDIYDSCLFENESGVDNRAKYRIRMYNGNPASIHLEKKCKVREMTGKITEEIALKECQTLISGGRIERNDLLSREWQYLMQSKYMTPKCIVEYARCAMTDEIGNVRITFDMDISGCLQPELFLNRTSDVFHPVMPAGMHILEVKYDELLPEYILQAVDLNMLQRQSVSKYVLTRKNI